MTTMTNVAEIIEPTEEELEAQIIMPTITQNIEE